MSDWWSRSACVCSTGSGSDLNRSRARFMTACGGGNISTYALIGFRGGEVGSCDQGGDEGSEQGFAASACVVHELEEAEIERQLVLRDAAVRAQPGAQQRAEALDGVDVHLAEAVAVLIARILAAPVADRLVLVAPSG